AGPCEDGCGQGCTKCNGERNQPRTSLHSILLFRRRLTRTAWVGPAPPMVTTPSCKSDASRTRGLASSRDDEVLLGLRVENVQLVAGDRKLHLVPDAHFLVGRDERDDLVALGLGAEELFVAEVLDDVHLRRQPDGVRARL